MADNPCSAIAVCLFLAACGIGDGKQSAVELSVPRGYVSTLEIEFNGKLLKFGPFVGYYFKPDDPRDLYHLQFVCFNENGFYTRDRPPNARLFEGEAIFATLPDADTSLPQGDERIQPLFFPDTPPKWLATRPKPQDEFIHFHSCYDDRGPVYHGYWLRHVAVAEFTYDMGGRVGRGSPLYHKVYPGVDREFAQIVEFDRGRHQGAR